MKSSLGFRRSTRKDNYVFLVIFAAIAGLLPIIFVSLGPLDIDLFKIFMLLGGLTYLGISSQKGSLNIPKDKQLLTLSILLSWFLLSGIWASNIILTISHSFVFSLFIIFYLLILLFTKTQHDLYKWVYCLPLTVFFTLGFDFNYLIGSETLRHHGDEGIVLIGALGEAAAISILPLLFIYLFNDKFLPRLYSFMGLIACGIALVVSASRAGLIAVIFNISTFTFLLLRNRVYFWKLSKTISIIILTSLIAFFSIDYFSPESKALFVARWISTFNPEVAYKRVATYYWKDNPRLDLWNAALAMFESKPLTGVGFGNYREEVSKIDPFLSFWHMAHNVYLDILSETGIVGVTIFLFLVGCCLRNYHVTAKRLRIVGFKKDYFLVRAMEVTFWGLLLLSALRTTLFEPPLYIFMALSHVSRKAYVAA